MMCQNINKPTETKEYFHINPFYATGLFLYTLIVLRHQKTRGFLTFSGGIERDQWHEMD